MRGGSAPAIRRALTVAEVITPLSGASTVAWRRANWRKPTSTPAGQPSQAKPSGVADVSCDPRKVAASAREAPTVSAARNAAAMGRGRTVMPVMRTTPGAGSLPGVARDGHERARRGCRS